MPASVLVMLVGTIPAWLWGQPWSGGGTWEAVSAATETAGFYMPSILPIESLSKTGVTLLTFSSVIFPVAFTLTTGTMLTVFAAREQGDDYPMLETIAVDGLSTIVAGLFGSPISTNVYFGHAAYKKRGGRYIYSVMNCVVFSAFALTGLFNIFTALIPEAAYGPVILFVGLTVNKDAGRVTDVRHLPAYFIALFPVICDWVTGQSASDTFYF